MSNLRIKNKKLKQENERLRDALIATKPTYIIHHKDRNILKLRSEKMLSELDLYYKSDCVERLKRELLEEVYKYISISCQENSFNWPLPILRAEIDVVRKE